MEIVKKNKKNKKKNETYNKRRTKLLNKQPQRTCMGCNVKKDKRDLIRIVKNKDNEISIDKTGKKEGRGAYICDDIQCLEKVVKSKRLEKTLDIKISEEIYENLRGVILGEK